MDTPQRFGILPTRWFWKDRSNRRLVGWAFAAVAVASMLIKDLLGLSIWTHAAILIVALLLTEGLLERYIRRQAAKRRLALATAEPPGQDEAP